MFRVPDLVRDTRLETRIKGNVTCHLILESDPSGRERAVTRKEYWKRTKRIGRGGFANVWLEKCVKGEKDMTWRALKEIPKPATTRHSNDYNRELEALAKFSQQRYVRCFVRSLGWYEDQSNIYIAMEYFPLGDLHHFLKDAPPLPEKDMQSIMHQLLEGLVMLHENGFAHRDLKPGNILIQSQDPWWVKIGDFGISKRLEEGREASSTVKGTLTFMAPELLNFVDKGECFPDAHSTSCASDLWALGEIAFQILTKESMFANLGLLHAYTRNTTSFPEAALRQAGAKDDCVDLVRCLVNPSPKSRPRADKAMEHQWFTAQRSSSPRPPSESSDRFSDFEDTTTLERTRSFARNDTIAEPSGVWSERFPDDDPTSIAFSPLSSQDTLPRQPADNETQQHHRSFSDVGSTRPSTSRIVPDRSNSSQAQTLASQNSTSRNVSSSKSASIGQIEEKFSQISIEPAQKTADNKPTTQKGEVMFAVPASQNGDLALNKGDRITITWWTDNLEDFWVGFTADGRVGRFPGYAVWIPPQNQALPHTDEVKASTETKSDGVTKIVQQSQPDEVHGISSKSQSDSVGNAPSITAAQPPSTPNDLNQIPKVTSNTEIYTGVAPELPYNAEYIKNHVYGIQATFAEFVNFRYIASVAQPENFGIPPGFFRLSVPVETLVVVDIQSWPTVYEISKFLHNIFNQVSELVKSDEYRHRTAYDAWRTITVLMTSSSKLNSTQLDFLGAIGIAMACDGPQTFQFAYGPDGTSVGEIVRRGQEVDPISGKPVTAQIFQVTQDSNIEVGRRLGNILGSKQRGCPLQLVFVDDHVNDHVGWSKTIQSNLGAYLVVDFTLDGSWSKLAVPHDAVYKKWKLAIDAYNDEQTTQSEQSSLVALGPFLRNSTQFNELRRLVQREPAMLEPILQQIAADNPGLAQMIADEQETFLEWLSEDFEEVQNTGAPSQSISITEDERDAIERLTSMGFKRDMVIQAYFACDKDEQDAVQFLYQFGNG